MALVAACVGVDAGAEPIRCTSKNGSSVIRRDKCDSPDDERTPVTVKSPVTDTSLAQLMLGDIYKSGRGVPKDEAKGYAWTRKAAE